MEKSYQQYSAFAANRLIVFSQPRIRVAGREEDIESRVATGKRGIMQTGARGVTWTTNR